MFLHEPEPTAENLRDICPLVAAHQAAIGFVLDPDSDRLALIDETGRYIGEELTLALAVAFRLRHERGPVVINMSTSRVIEDIAAKHGCACHRSAVGEANVVDKMLEVGALIGGEGNGGVIDPRVGWVRDPFIGMGLMLNLMAETGRKLSELVAELPAYHIVKDKYTVPRERLPELFASLNEALAGGDSQSARRPAPRLARSLAARPAEQHRTDRPRHRRGAEGKRCDGIVSSRGDLLFSETNTIIRINSPVGFLPACEKRFVVLWLPGHFFSRRRAARGRCLRTSLRKRLAIATALRASVKGTSGPDSG